MSDVDAIEFINRVFFNKREGGFSMQFDRDPIYEVTVGHNPSERVAFSNDLSEIVTQLKGFMEHETARASASKA